MKKIMIIGAGQLGSRHLQGAARCHLPLEINVVDRSAKSLDIAKSRVNDITTGNSKTRIQYNQKIEANAEIDLCIIATTSNVRFQVLEELISQCFVKNILFEKVLFQKVSEYLIVEKLLLKNNIKAWVNCPRRMNPSYKKIQKLLVKETSLSMIVRGSNWGLACNAIHFIDLFSFLTGCPDYELNGSKLDKSVVSSKRPKFYEAFGRLLGIDSLGNCFHLQCSPDSITHVEVELISPNYEILIKEFEGEVLIFYNGKEFKERFNQLYQSELTNLNIEEIIEHGCSSLTSFSESKKLHLPFIQLMKKHIEVSLNKSLDSCPIT
ncbi:hypothetical protein N9401_00580 [Amylibacter sp.]|nr:hypothetical protein [Amylibacter sp.]